MFYDIYSYLCKVKGVTPSRAADELHINKSNVSNWKKQGYTPRGDALQRIAEYFDVSTDYLLGKTDEKNPVTEESADEAKKMIDDDDIKFALFGGADNITDEMYEDVKAFARFIREQKKNGNNN